MEERGQDFYVSLLKTGKPFAFSRWGNGEFACMKMIGPKHHNASGHQYFYECGQDLATSLRLAFAQQGHHVGLQGTCFRDPHIMPQWAQAMDAVWEYSDWMHHCSSRAQMLPFIQALRKKKLLLVGPAYMKTLSAILPIVAHVEIPRKNCWLDKHRVVQETLAKAPKSNTIIISASLLADPLIVAIYPKVKQPVLNCGSLWDPYVGHHTRRYHRKMTKEVMDKNICTSTP
jgi:hypothetical protein